MSLFLPNIPKANDNLDFSQGQLLSNNAGLDTVFGIDHYKFSDATANKGFHNKVSTPPFVGPALHPTTLPGVAVIYGALAGNLGVMNFSKKGNKAATEPSTPITMWQSPGVAVILPGGGSTTDVFDFTGLPRAMAVLTASNNSTVPPNPPALVGIFSYVFWTGTVLVVANIANAGTPLTAIVAGPKLQLKNSSTFTLTELFWTLQFMRVQ